jgi:predicted nucleic acid-binding protein
VLVPALTRELATARAQAWLDHEDPNGLVISDWVVTEFAAALSVKIRMNQLTAENRPRAISLFTRLRADWLIVVPITREHFMTAARFADQSGLGLRAGDALHVAVAADRGATICALDKRLGEAATALGVAVEFV